MFPLSNVELRPIAPTLLPIAQQIEEQSPNLYVLAARQFRYPVQQQKVSVKIEKYRKINLLEKYILRAIVDIEPTPSLDEVAGVLGLDPIFINGVFHELSDSKHIIRTNEGLQVTEEGKKILVSETISTEPIYESWYYLQDAVLDRSSFVHRPLDEMDEEFEDIEDLNHYIRQDLMQFPAFEMNAMEQQSQLRKSGLDAHDPNRSQFVTQIALSAPPEQSWQQIAIFALYDADCEDEDARIIFQARFEDEVVQKVGEWLEEQLREQNLSLKVLCGLTDDVIEQEEATSQVDDASEGRFAEIDRQVTKQRRLQSKGQEAEQETSPVIQFRDVKIRPAFMEALREAREQIIIYSPWMNEQAVDDEFLSLLEDRVKRGVRILIGYGIGLDEKREERPVPLTLLRRLSAIQTVEHTPGIIAAWLGNSHAKEVVIDRKIHFTGSQNWLSYRGDRFPRGETVYQVMIAAEVERAYDYLAQRFIERAKVLWTRATNDERKLALCILGYLGHEQEAAAWLQSDECYHLLPLWLALAHQAISSGQEARIIASLQALITLYNSLTDLSDPLREEIDAALQSVLKRVAQKNLELSVDLVSSTLLMPGRLETEK